MCESNKKIKKIKTNKNEVILHSKNKEKENKFLTIDSGHIWSLKVKDHDLKDLNQQNKILKDKALNFSLALALEKKKPSIIKMLSKHYQIKL